jgi:hypothetical protein
MTVEPLVKTSKTIRMTPDEHSRHIDEMKRVTGHDGRAPRSERPQVNVRELVASLG